MFIDLQSPKPKIPAGNAPARIRHPVKNSILLPRPSKSLSQRFGNVLLRRRSSSDLAPLNLSQLGDFLWHCCKPRDLQIDPVGRVWQSRPTPSAGGTHSIDLFLLNVPQHQEAVHIYDPLGHTLNEMEVGGTGLGEQLRALAMEVKEEPEATVIWYVAQVAILDSYYKNAESLLWRDAGALLATHHLVAAAMELRCCAIGATGDPFVKEFHAGLRGVGGLFIGT